MNIFARFLEDDSGATAIEYALIAAIIGVGLITSLGLLRDGINNAFGNITNKLNTPGV